MSKVRECGHNNLESILFIDSCEHCAEYVTKRLNRHESKRIAELEAEVKHQSNILSTWDNSVLELGNKFSALKQENTTLKERLKQFELFIDDILQAMWDDSLIDGGDIQEIAERHGVIEPIEVTEPCGEHCRCAEYGFPSTCYRKKELPQPPKE